MCKPKTECEHPERRPKDGKCSEAHQGVPWGEEREKLLRYQKRRVMKEHNWSKEQAALPGAACSFTPLLSLVL